MCDDFVGVHEIKIMLFIVIVLLMMILAMVLMLMVVGGPNADDDAVVAIVHVVGSVADMVHCVDAVEGRVFENMMMLLLLMRHE